jgi:nucleotide-binding universal stress UspA family protein
MYRHILVPTDGCPLSERAVKAAVMLAKLTDAKLLLFHVVPPHSTLSYAEGNARPWVAIEKEGTTEQAAALVREVFASSTKSSDLSGVKVDKQFVVSFSPYEAILDAAEKHGCDLIVMASHGRRGFSGLLLGSETQKVLTHSRLPVLVVH